MTEAERCGIKQAILPEVIASDDDPLIVLAYTSTPSSSLSSHSPHPPSPPPKTRQLLEKELEYLASKGYQPSADLSIEHRFSKFQIGSTEESLEAIEKEESEAVVERIFGRKRPIRSKVG